MVGRKDGYGIRQVYTSTKGIILGFTRDLIIKGIPGPRRDPQMVLWTEERVPEPAWPTTILISILHVTIEPSSGDGWRWRRTTTLEHWT